MYIGYKYENAKTAPRTIRAEKDPAMKQNEANKTKAAWKPHIEGKTVLFVPAELDMAPAAGISGGGRKRSKKGVIAFFLLLLLIGCIVLDMICAILAAQLWKKANHIKPMSEKRGKFLFYVWNELGVIMACICFIPLIILLLKNDKLDKKTKIIATIVAIVALLVTGVASADFNPITAEEKDAAEEQITTDVFWTQFGHKYHLNIDEEGGCPYVRDSATVYKGTVTEAIESGRTAICSYCASHYAEEMGLQLEDLNVEDKDAVLQEVGDNPAPEATGGN